MTVPALLAATLVAAAVLLAAPGASRRLGTLGDVDSGGPRERPAAPPGGGRRGPPPSAAEVALLMDLVAAAMSAGLPPVRALELAGSALPGATGEAVTRLAALWMLGASPETGWDTAAAELGPLRRVLLLVSTAGVPGVPLLHAAATELRRRERRRAQARAEALAVRMVLPLGLCALPAFVAWAVVPVVLSLAQEVLR